MTPTHLQLTQLSGECVCQLGWEDTHCHALLLRCHQLTFACFHDLSFDCFPNVTFSICLSYISHQTPIQFWMQQYVASKLFLTVQRNFATRRLHDLPRFSLPYRYRYRYSNTVLYCTVLYNMCLCVRDSSSTVFRD